MAANWQDSSAGYLFLPGRGDDGVGLVIIGAGGVVAAFGGVGDDAIVVGRGDLGIETKSAVVIGQAALVFALFGEGVAAIVISEGEPAIQADGAGVIGDGPIDIPPAGVGQPAIVIRR